MSSDATVTAEDSPRFTRVEHTSSNRNIVLKFAQTGQDKKMEELTNINSIGKKKKKKRKIFGSLFKRKNRRRLFGEPIDPQASIPPPVLETLISHLETKGKSLPKCVQTHSLSCLFCL
jgi:hypothetical protein